MSDLKHCTPFSKCPQDVLQWKPTAKGLADCEKNVVDRYILIIAAVAEELTDLRERLGHSSIDRKVEKPIISGRLAGQSVGLLETGPGQINTARALTATIEAEKPALVIQTGCAGVFDVTGLSLGDIGIASEEIDVQLGVEVQGEETIVSPLPFIILKKGMTQIRNTYPMEPDLVENTHLVLKETFAAVGIKVAAGPFITVSTITSSDLRAKKYHREYGALMENMEGAAAAHICIHYGIPFLEIRSASNRVGQRDKKNWNLPLAFGQASRAVYAAIEGIVSGKILP